MRWFVLSLLLLGSCIELPPLDERAQFERWLAGASERADAFARFEQRLQAAGVLGVVPTRQLWLVDRLHPECVSEPFRAPPEEVWERIIPTLAFVRDHVEPAVGEVRVVSAYRDPAFNTCVGGAPQSAHRDFYALDLAPADRRVSREDLIARLCPIHADAGARANVGLGIYAGQRFHIDARGFRGWGPDFHRTTFPCDTR